LCHIASGFHFFGWINEWTDSQADGQTDMIQIDGNIEAVNRSQSLESQTDKQNGHTNRYDKYRERT
jgi:hypothetical protein